MVDGCIPSDMATGTRKEIEEERRLLYVAMTRAKDELDLIVPHRFYTYQQPSFGDSHVYAAVSRFIPSSIRDLFDSQHWEERTRSPAKVGVKSGATTTGPSRALCSARGWVGRSAAHFQFRAVELVPGSAKMWRRP